MAFMNLCAVSESSSIIHLVKYIKEFKNKNEDKHNLPQQSWLNSGHQQIHAPQWNQKSIKNITNK